MGSAPPHTSRNKILKITFMIILKIIVTNDTSTTWYFPKYFLFKVSLVVELNKAKN
jgi:hypothetical protein